MRNPILRAVAALAGAARRPDVDPPAPVRIYARHVGVQQLGRWIEIPGRPAEPRVVNEPSLISRGGRLVGFHADVEPARSPSTRTFVLLAGSVVEVAVRADELVIVAPREWS